MADKKISQLTALAAANLAPSTDVLAIVDTSATETKKIVAQDLINGVLNVASAVGIGTASPTSKLHVVGTGTYVATFNNSSDDTRIELQKSGTQYGQISVSTTSLNLVGSQSNTAIKFLINGGTTTAVTIDSSGNLGLGVTPAAGVRFDVRNNSTTTLADMRNANASGYGIYIAAGSSSSQYVQRWADYNNNALATLDASGNLGVGTTSPYARLQAFQSSSTLPAAWIYRGTQGSDGNLPTTFGYPYLQIGAVEYRASAIQTIGFGYISANGNFPPAEIGLQTTSTSGQTYGDLVFATRNVTTNTAATERARITAAGEFIGGKTTAGVDTNGWELGPSGVVGVSRQADIPMYVNRNGDDGILVSYRQDGNGEGSVSVSGNTVSYNAFAGSHWSQLQDGSKPDILRGTVMESINELCVWPGENNERLPKSKISDTAGSKKVYGVFMAWDNDWTETNDMYVTAVGAFICRVNGSVTVQEGDLLESNGDGTARVQADDIIRSSTIGKVTSTVKTHQYDDGSYCVPTVLYCG